MSEFPRVYSNYDPQLRKMGYALACNADLLEGRYPGGAHPNALLGSVLSVVVDFGVPVYFCSDRQCACRFVADYLECYTRVIEERDFG